MTSSRFFKSFFCSFFSFSLWKKKALFIAPYFQFSLFLVFFFVFFGNFGLHPIFYSIFRLYINFGSFFFFFSSVLCNLLFLCIFFKFSYFCGNFGWGLIMLDMLIVGRLWHYWEHTRRRNYSFSGIKLGNSYKFWICL